MATRTLADRLAAIRVTGRRARRPSPTIGSRRWRAGSARAPLSSRAGRALVVERQVRLPAGAVAAVAALPPGRLLRHGDDRPVDRRGHRHLPCRRRPRRRRRASLVRQYLLPDYPYERPLLRALAADLATAPRLVTYNGRAFDIPMLAARLTFHGLFREQAGMPGAHDDLLPDRPPPLPAAPGRRAAGGCRGRRARRAANVRLPGQRGAGPLLRLPAAAARRTSWPWCSTTTCRTSSAWRCWRPR